MALWPLIAVSNAQRNAPGAIEFLKLLLAREQQPLPLPLRRMVEEAIGKFEQTREKEALDLTSRAVQLASELAYL
jgi:hypothetical protein